MGSEAKEYGAEIAEAGTLWERLKVRAAGANDNDQAHGPHLVASLDGFAVARRYAGASLTLTVGEGASSELSSAIRRAASLRSVLGGFGGIVSLGATGDGRSFCVGPDLETHAGEVPHLGWDLPRKLGLFVRVSRAIQCMHEAGEYQAQLSPQHVLLDGNLQSYVLGPNIVVDGADAYRAPEQVAGAAPSVRGDLFALGALLHFILTGSEPKVADGELPLLEAMSHFPIGLARIVRRCMAPEAQRYSSVFGVLADLDRYRTHDAVGLDHPEEHAVRSSGEYPVIVLDDASLHHTPSEAPRVADVAAASGASASAGLARYVMPVSASLGAGAVAVALAGPAGAMTSSVLAAFGAGLLAGSLPVRALEKRPAARLVAATLAMIWAGQLDMPHLQETATAQVAQLTADGTGE